MWSAALQKPGFWRETDGVLSRKGRFINKVSLVVFFSDQDKHICCSGQIKIIIVVALFCKSSHSKVKDTIRALFVLNTYASEDGSHTNIMEPFSCSRFNTMDVPYLLCPRSWT